MNRLIIAITLNLTAGFQAFSQGIGTFEFMNVGVTADRQIYIDNYLTGPKAAGTGYKIAVYWGPTGTTDENALLQVGAPTTFLDPPGEGQFNGGARTVAPTSEDGAVVALQARAWDASTGFTTWEQAAADPAGRVGKGPVFEMKLKDPSDPFENLPRLGYAAGWQGFAITPVPEPSVWALAAAGVAALLLFRVRK